MGPCAWLGGSCGSVIPLGLRVLPFQPAGRESMENAPGGVCGPALGVALSLTFPLATAGWHGPVSLWGRPGDVVCVPGTEEDWILASLKRGRFCK